MLNITEFIGTVGFGRKLVIIFFIQLEDQIRNTWKVLKCGAGGGWRRSFGTIM
jgi:hypothetical protein